MPVHPTANPFNVDSFFRVDTLSATPNPASVIWSAAHCDYSEGYIYDEWMAGKWPDESRAEKLILKHLMHNHRPHSGPLEHAHIVMATSGFPHNVAMQHRTHRVPWSFDVQSQRYTGERVIQVANLDLPIEEVFYFRAEGDYRDRQGNNYTYDSRTRAEDMQGCMNAAMQYKRHIEQGYAPEHARDILPQNIRQNYVFSTNARGLMHFFNMRTAADAQYEIRILCDLMFPHFEAWLPGVARWYRGKYWGKSPLTF